MIGLQSKLVIRGIKKYYSSQFARINDSNTLDVIVANAMGL